MENTQIQNEKIQKAYNILVDVMEVDGDWKYLAMKYGEAISKVIEILNTELK